MTKQKMLCVVQLFVATLVSTAGWAGSLDDAPFKVVVPGAGWQVDDAGEKPMGKNVFVSATVVNEETGAKLVIIRATLDAGENLETLSAGVRRTLENPAVKVISETGPTFLGYPAKLFVYQANQGEQVIHSESVVFVENGNGWTIACIGDGAKADDVRAMFRFVQKK